MGESSLKVKGSCLCRDTQYTVEGEPVYNVVCHCENCRLSTGTQFMAASIFKKTQFQITSDKSLKHYQDYRTESEKPLLRYFCSNCGSSCFAMTEVVPDIVSVFSGTLENATSWKPVKEQFVTTKSHWLPDFGISDRHKMGPWSDPP